MSLILEALRKSEAERRRGAIPELHGELPTSPVLARSTVPGWLLWVLAAAAVVLASLWAVHAWQPRAPVATTTVATSAAAVAPKRAAPVLPPVKRLSPPPAAAIPSTPRAPVVATASREKPAPPQAAPTGLTPPPAYSPPPKSAPVARDDTMSLSDLSADERKALPPLKLSMHLWNDDPSRRFVILDGNRLKEGDRAGDAVITAITTDGVVLDWNGRRIKLSIR